MNIDWTAISAIFTAIGSCSTAISIVVLIATLFYIQREVHLARVSTYAGAYKAIVEILQAEEIRAARRYLFENLEKNLLTLGTKKINEWLKKCAIHTTLLVKWYDMASSQSTIL